VSALLRVGLVALKVVDRRANLVALLLARTNRIDSMPDHLQRLKRNHDLVVFNESPASSKSFAISSENSLQDKFTLPVQIRSRCSAGLSRSSLSRVGTNNAKEFVRSFGAYGNQMPSIVAQPVLHPFKSWHSVAIKKKLPVLRKKFFIVIQLWSPVGLFEHKGVLGIKSGCFTRNLYRKDNAGACAILIAVPPRRGKNNSIRNHKRFSGWSRNEERSD